MLAPGHGDTARATDGGEAMPMDGGKPKTKGPTIPSSLAKYSATVRENYTALGLQRADEHNLCGLTLLHETYAPARAVNEFSRAIYLNPNEPSYRLHRAEAYLALAHFGASEVDYREALRLAGRPPGKCGIVDGRLGSLYVTLAQVQLDSGQYSTALRLLDEAAGHGMPMAMTRLPWTLIHIGLGAYDEALQALDALLPESRKPSDLMALAIRINCMLDRFDTVNAQLQQLRQLAPFHAEIAQIQLYLVRSAIQFKNAADALLLAAAATPLVDEQLAATAVRYYNKAIELDPHDQGSLEHRGRAYMAAGMFENALADFFACLDHCRPAVDASRPETAADLSRGGQGDGMRLKDELQTDAARPNWQADEEQHRARRQLALERLLGSANALWAQAVLLGKAPVSRDGGDASHDSDAERRKRAIELLDTALLFDGTSAQLLFQRAEMYLLDGQVEAAGRDFNSAFASCRARLDRGPEEDAVESLFALPTDLLGSQTSVLDGADAAAKQEIVLALLCASVAHAAGATSLAAATGTTSAATVARSKAAVAHFERALQLWSNVDTMVLKARAQLALRQHYANSGTDPDEQRALGAAAIATLRSALAVDPTNAIVREALLSEGALPDSNSGASAVHPASSSALLGDTARKLLARLQPRGRQPTPADPLLGHLAQSLERQLASLRTTLQSRFSTSEHSSLLVALPVRNVQPDAAVIARLPKATRPSGAVAPLAAMVPYARLRDFRLYAAS